MMKAIVTTTLCVGLAAAIVYAIPKDKDAIQPSEVDAFAKRLAVVMQHEFQSSPQEPGSSHKVVVKVDLDDVVKTDSVTHPLMAKVILKSETDMKDNNGWSDIMHSTFDLRFVKKDGKFVLNKGTIRTQRSLLDHEGSEENLATDWFADDILKAQK
jgi:hypothetical protein